MMADETVQADEKRAIMTVSGLTTVVATVFLVIIGTAFGYYLAVTTPNQFVQCSDTNTLNALAFMFIQDTNQHQIILNAITSEQQARALLNSCKALSQDFNRNTITLECPAQGGG